MDKASSHTAHITKEVLPDLGIIQLPYPPFSPDIAPSAFFLFGYLKARLRGTSVSDNGSLFEAAWKIMNAIPSSTRLRVFHEWMWRLEQVIENGGEYY
jgi:histone-lysine N-methyltransferase SETMAR